MKLRFPIQQINELAKRYVNEMTKRDHLLSHIITQQVFPSYLEKGYLTKREFLHVCSWKTPRSKKWCEKNDESFIKEISKLALTINIERLRIEIWTLLYGVKWPTASVFLHFSFSDKYPILDYRALWSLNTEVPSRYTFQFWEDYTDFCRNLINEAGVTMRVLDQALWKYSELNQGKRG